MQSTEAPAYALSFAAGRVVTTNSADTLADGMATRVPDEEALEIICKGAARIVLVSDDEMAAAIRAYWTDTHNLAEGAGAAALAAAVQEKAKFRRQAGRPRAERRQHRFRSVRKWVTQSAATTGAVHERPTKESVIAGLVPAIHVYPRDTGSGCPGQDRA